MTVQGPHVHGASRQPRATAVRLEIDLRPFRYVGSAMLALGVALPHVPGNPGLPCPLRMVTGVPCPFCGLTTSVKAVLGGHFGLAWSANPAGLVIAALAVALLVGPHWHRVYLPPLAPVGGIALSWLFELHRYHFL